MCCECSPEKTKDKNIYIYSKELVGKDQNLCWKLETSYEIFRSRNDLIFFSSLLKSDVEHSLNYLLNISVFFGKCLLGSFAHF